ncbi:c-type cytochrome [Akkermansiaceae bacterium]|nr:c-type cytochrome [Akkermansiaceae bacterium]
MKNTVLGVFAAGFAFSVLAQAEVTDMTADFKVAAGFKLEKIHDVTKDEGSWVGLTEDDKGRLIATDQYGGLFRITVPPLSGGQTKVEALDIAVSGGHGVLWFKGKLYIVVNENVKKNPSQTGVWVVEDKGDGWGTPELLKGIKAGGEHGIHSLVVSPDKEWLYLVSGNYGQLPDLSDSFPAKVWEEDQLLPKNKDGRGHAANVNAPAGWITRFRPDGSDWQLVSMGQRNTYDAAFHDNGELFSYDADMEWDFGMPWYRPTRIIHAVPGTEQGWRNGSGKWPEYYEDSVKPVLNIGPGSPTGVVAGRGFKAPAKYQQAIYALDWTFATIYALHMTPDGASYSVEKEEFVAGAGLPVTDAVIGRDGAMYFATGGRKGVSHLWRVIYTGSEPTAPQPAAKAVHEVRDKLSEYVRNPKSADGALVLENLGSDDRTLRFLAKAALERFPNTDWAPRIAEQENPWTRIMGTMAMARMDGKKHRDLALKILMDTGWESLSLQQKLNWLRSAGLVFIRGGEPSDAERKAVIAKIDKSYPSDERTLNFELARMLCYLQAPGVVARTLKLMDEAPAEQPEPWQDLVERNSRYGKDINEVMKNQPPRTQIHYLYCLRAVKGPWGPGERRRAFNWFREIESRRGGNSYAPAIAMIRQQIYDNGTEDEKKLFAADAKAPAKAPKALPPVQGPGRAWTIEEVVKVTSEGLEGRDKAKGQAMFEASLCSACHKFGTEGGAQGPDLTNLAGRFSAEDLAHSIIEPSEVISDQYEFTEIITHDGKTTVGRVLNEQDEILVIGINPFDFAQQIEISRADIKSIAPSKVSPMPPAMINRLNPDELKDLFAYLLGK